MRLYCFSFQDFLAGGAILSCSDLPPFRHVSKIFGQYPLFSECCKTSAAGLSRARKYHSETNNATIQQFNIRGNIILAEFDSLIYLTGSTASMVHLEYFFSQPPPPPLAP